MARKSIGQSGQFTSLVIKAPASRPHPPKSERAVPSAAPASSKSLVAPDGSSPFSTVAKPEPRARQEEKRTRSQQSAESLARSARAESARRHLCQSPAKALGSMAAEMLGRIDVPRVAVSATVPAAFLIDARNHQGTLRADIDGHFMVFGFIFVAMFSRRRD